MNLHRLDSQYRLVLGSLWDVVLAGAKRTHVIENVYVAKVNEEFDKAIEDAIKNDGQVDADFIEELLIDHMLTAMRHSVIVATEQTKHSVQKFAARPKNPIGRNIFEIYKEWKKNRKKPPLTKKQRAKFKDLKKSFLDKVKQTYAKYSDDYRNGKASLHEVKQEIKKATGATENEVKTIVRTEGTSYDNAVRQDFYKGVPGVTHMLFLPIRDSATTKWCHSRDGKVFEKGSALQIKNTPAVHWNCRSEMVPLSIFNPNHKKMIEDPSRRPVDLFPLPPGWGIEKQRIWKHPSKAA